MATQVLIHGGWSGSYVFRQVRRGLQSLGHEVFTPSLTGLGERVHLASPQVGLTTHVQDVVNVILYEDLQAITLLGYSYGGAVVTASLEHVADRVRHLVYLDAFVPADGESMLDLVGIPRPTLAIGAPYYLPAVPREFDDPAEAEFQNARRLPHPMATGLEPVRLDRPLEEFEFTRTYIRATASDPGEIGNAHFEVAAQHAKSSTSWDYHEIPTNHMVLSNRPDDVVAILDALS